MLIELSEKFCRDHRTFVGYEIRPAQFQKDGVKDIFFQVVWSFEDSLYFTDAFPTEESAIKYAREIKDKINEWIEELDT